MRAKTNSRGFTLIELLVAMVVVAILAAVALPSYRNYVIRGKIPDATSNLGAKRVKMEQYFQDNRAYDKDSGGNANPLLANDSKTSQYFDFSGVATPSSYVLTATGKASMTGFSFTIDQAGNKTSTVTGVSGWSSAGNCWVTRQGGQC